MVYFVVYTVPYATIVFPFMHARNRYWMAAGWCKSTIVVLRHLIGIRYTIQGMENLPDGPAVLLSKISAGNARVSRADAASALLCLQA